MAVRERRIDRGRRTASRALDGIGDELREARVGAGLSQRAVGDVVGVSHTEISRIERGLALRVPYQTLVLVGAALGLDVPHRAYPNGDRIRDRAQIALLARLRSMLPATVSWRTEVPIRQPGDRRAWDAVAWEPNWRVPVDAETRLRDIQALSRNKTLKRRDDESDLMILLVADTRHNREVLRLARADLVADFPVSAREAIRELSAGRPPSGSAIVLL